MKWEHITNVYEIIMSLNSMKIKKGMNYNETNKKYNLL